MAELIECAALDYQESQTDLTSPFQYYIFTLQDAIADANLLVDAYFTVCALDQSRRIECCDAYCILSMPSVSRSVD
jgi:hypothetical protein